MSTVPPPHPLTEEDLVADLSRLLREGLVCVDDQNTGIPRFRVTAKGQHYRAGDEPGSRPALDVDRMGDRVPGRLLASQGGH